jgi:hypothetical protein
MKENGLLSFLIFFINLCSVKNKKMDTLIIHADSDKIKAIMQFLKAFDIPFEMEEEKPYKKEFVERVLLADKEIEEGKGVKIALDDLWK